MNTKINWYYDIELLKSELIKCGELNIIFSDDRGNVNYTTLSLDDFKDYYYEHESGYNLDKVFFTNAGNTNNYLKEIYKYSIIDL